MSKKNKLRISIKVEIDKGKQAKRAAREFFKDLPQGTQFHRDKSKYSRRVKHKKPHDHHNDVRLFFIKRIDNI